MQNQTEYNLLYDCWCINCRYTARGKFSKLKCDMHYVSEKNFLPFRGKMEESCFAENNTKRTKNSYK